MIIYLNNHHVHACLWVDFSLLQIINFKLIPLLFITKIANFCENGKFRMKCVEKYDASAEDASR